MKNYEIVFYYNDRKEEGECFIFPISKWEDVTRCIGEIVNRENNQITFTRLNCYNYYFDTWERYIDRCMQTNQCPIIVYHYIRCGEVVYDGYFGYLREVNA